MTYMYPAKPSREELSKDIIPKSALCIEKTTPRIELNEEQSLALTRFIDWVNEPKSFQYVLKGQAGTGKTTMISKMVEYFDNHDIRDMLILTALTHKAAGVLSKVTDEDVRTLHSCLGVKPYRSDDGIETYQAIPGADTIKKDSIIIVDEAVMINRNLWVELLTQAEMQHLRFVFVADPYQLLPVKEDRSWALDIDECIHSKLNKVERHDSAILNLSTALCEVVKTGSIPLKISEHHNPKKGIHIVPRAIFDEELFAAMKKNYGVTGFVNPDGCKYLAWTNRNVNATMKWLRTDALGFKDAIPVMNDIMVFNNAYTKWNHESKREEVIFSNNAEVAVTNIQPDTFEASVDLTTYTLEGYYCDVMKKGTTYTLFCPLELEDRETLLSKMSAYALQTNQKVRNDPSKVNYRIRKSAWKKYYNMKNDLVDLRFPYACTVHKSQGSTYKDVFIDAVDIRHCPEHDLVNRMLYVAASRATASVWITE